MLNLYAYQQEAIENLKSGAVLCGGVGSGKSRTALGYYIQKVLPENISGGMVDLYIITTARKRDTGEWLDECCVAGLDTSEVTIDSWNNIGKYRHIAGAFFIFDEQRVVGSGSWVKAFLDICRKNTWILLSATPGDTWSDYIPVFVANGFYKNRTELLRRHAVYDRFAKYPKIVKWIEESRLELFRRSILVDMDYIRKTVGEEHWITCGYDKAVYEMVAKDRWNVFECNPIENPGELCYLLRRVVNENEYRLVHTRSLITMIPKLIIFYNFDYELELLRSLVKATRRPVGEWNGHRHEPIPAGDEWVYLVQYTAGAEGWNCVETNCILFYSLNYSWKLMQQARGRIDRLNTPFDVLHYYFLYSNSPIDRAIRLALEEKRAFNEKRFIASLEV